MSRPESDLWIALRSPDAAVGVFLGAGGSHSRRKPSLTGAAGLADAARNGAGGTAAAQDGISPGVIALTAELAEVDEDTWGLLITQAARTFRSAEACLTARLGPGEAVDIDEETWVASGLPEPVLEAASCTTSLVVSWSMEGGGWCVLEVDQESAERPIAVILYRVDG